MRHAMIRAGMLATLAGCAQMLTGATVSVLPGLYTPFEVFMRDGDVCRATGAANQSEATAWSAQRRYDIAYQQCMYALGNRVPGAALPAAVPPRTLRPPAE